VIKGFHRYKIRPPKPSLYITRLLVDREYTNIHDICSCLVWLPSLSSFPAAIHECVTDEKRHLKLSDVAGLPVGHVPRGLASCFRSILDIGGHVYAIPTGDPLPSFPPWPALNEKGGGVVIPCYYTIHCSYRDQCRALVRSALDSMPEGSTMRLIM